MSMALSTHPTATATATASKHALSNAPAEIQLPLHRPKHKQLQQLKPWRTIPTTNKRTAVSTPFDVLRLMDALRLPVSEHVYAFLVKECTDARDAAGAAQLHAHIRRSRSGLRPALSLLNRILLMHVTCGLVDIAHQMFDQMILKDLTSWAIMIAACADNGDYREAINLFLAMLRYHGNLLMFPAWIMVCLLKGCVHTMDMGLGKQVHGWSLKAGYGTNLFLSISLINFYGKFRCLPDANCVFLQTYHRDTVLWTPSIVNNCRQEHFVEVLRVFKEMGRAGLKKSSHTFSSVLRACGRMEDEGRCGRQVHADAIKHGVNLDTFVQCRLVEMYGKFGSLGDARRVFDTITDKRSVACWNSMLIGYMQHGCCLEALKLMYQMKAAGMQPQESLLNEVRIACGSKTFKRT